MMRISQPTLLERNLSSFLNHVNPPAASVCAYAQWVIRFETKLVPVPTRLLTPLINYFNLHWSEIVAHRAYGFGDG